MKHPESEEQTAFFRRISYVKYNGIPLRDYCYSVPNALPYGGKTAMLQMLQLKKEGLTKGIPDIECMIARGQYTGLHIEMKKVDGKPSDIKKEQKEKMELLKSCGRKCAVAFGAEQAFNILMGYLNEKPRA